MSWGWSPARRRLLADFADAQQVHRQRLEQAVAALDKGPALDLRPGREAAPETRLIVVDLAQSRRQFGKPAAAVIGEQVLARALEFGPFGVVLVQRGKANLDTDELGTGRVAVVLQPVGVDQVQIVRFGIAGDGLQECFSGGGHGEIEQPPAPALSAARSCDY